jgi:L,D-transpeptidase catalytic domain
MIRRYSGIVVLTVTFLLASCAEKDTQHRILVSVADQCMELFYNQRLVRRYPVSTSRYGLGDRPGSRETPTGRMEVAKMIGRGAPLGAVFRNRRPTGEILRPNAPGRDPIVTRIIWLRGLQQQNQNAFGRCIYIHGTPEERYIGHPASYGCVRMRSSDVLSLFNSIGVGAMVDIIPGSLPDTPQPGSVHPVIAASAPPAPVATLGGTGEIVGPPAPSATPQPGGAPASPVRRGG